MSKPNGQRRRGAALEDAILAAAWAEPFGDAVGGDGGGKVRKVRKIADPDPCAPFGPRRDIGRAVADAVVGVGTGLYAPGVAGAGAPPKPPKNWVAPASVPWNGLSRVGEACNLHPRDGLSAQPEARLEGAQAMIAHTVRNGLESAAASHDIRLQVATVAKLRNRKGSSAGSAQEETTGPPRDP